MLAAALAVLWLVLAVGERPMTGSSVAPPLGAVAAGAEPLSRFLLALAAVVILGQVLGRLLARLSQPPVIGEVIAGILLGPSLLGPERSALILPPEVAPLLGVVAQLGVILYMFIVGLDLSADLLRRRAGAAVAVSHASIVVPFILGAILSLYLYPRLSTGDVPFHSFALFMGTAMSITAFPVLARILTDRGMARTELGTLALGCAATDDATAWCLLAVIVGVARSAPGGAVGVLLGTLAYVGVMIVAVRPLLARLSGGWAEERLPRGVVALVFGALLLSCLATESIGIHAVFGAFLLGAMIPHDSAVARTFSRQLEPVVTTLLLPAFFAFTGMRTRIDLLTGLHMWLICGLIVLVATAGKFGGTYLAARLSGLSWRPAAALGALMNTRGLMELIVLNVGHDLGIIPPALFAMMVMMALATTMAAAPAVAWLLPRRDAGPPEAMTLA
jgi:Kef-type K+ transport system membrane component KefB